MREAARDWRPELRPGACGGGVLLGRVHKVDAGKWIVVLPGFLPKGLGRHHDWYAEKIRDWMQP